MLIAAQDPRIAPRSLPRSFVAFGALGAGMAVARSFDSVPAAAWFAIAASAVAVAALTGGWRCRVGLFVAAGAFGAGWFGMRIHEVPRGSLSAVVATGVAVLTVEGTVLEPPRIEGERRDPLHPLAHLSEPRARFRVAVTAILEEDRARSCRGVLAVALHGPPPAAIRPGDRVRISGAYRPVASPMNPGERDRQLWAAQDGLAGSLRTPGGSLIEPLPDGVGFGARARAAFLRVRADAQERARAFLSDAAPASESRAFLAALILGEEEPALNEVRSAFNRLGLAHALAISGFHLTVLAWVGLFGLRLTGDRGWVEPAAVAGLVGLYLFILPVQAPVWRSGMMTLGVLAADALGRRYDRLAMLGWTAVLLILYRPMDLWSLGFQLSFGLVALLIWLGPGTAARLFGGLRLDRPRGPTSAAAWAGRAAKGYVSNTLLCCVGATPIVIHQTGLVSFAAMVSSLVVLPCIVALLGLSYAALLVGVGVPAAAEWAAGALDVIARWTVGLVRWMDGVPYTSAHLPGVSLAWAIAATTLALYWFTRGHLRDRAAWLATGAVGAWLATEIVLGPRLAPATALRIDTLAVGDGTCHLIRSRGDAMLWDCGSLTPGVGRTSVPRAVRALGAWRTPTVVISHPNLDHFNGLLDAAGPLGIRQVLVGAAFMEQAGRAPGGPEAFLLERLAARGIGVRTLRAGDTLRLGDATATVLSPPDFGANAPWGKDNDRSLVAAFDVPTSLGTRRLLMTGDIETDAIEHLNRMGVSPEAVVIEAPHHGSARDAAIKFVAAIDPLVVLQSTGPERAGDERWDTVKRFRAWYTTATDGAAWAEIRRDGSVRSGAFRR